MDTTTPATTACRIGTQAISHPTHGRVDVVVEQLQ